MEIIGHVIDGIIMLFILWLLRKILSRQMSLEGYLLQIMANQAEEPQETVNAKTEQKIANVEKQLNPFGVRDILTVNVTAPEMASCDLEMIVTEVHGDELHVACTDVDGEESMLRSYGYSIPVWIDYHKVTLKRKANATTPTPTDNGNTGQ